MLILYYVPNHKLVVKKLAEMHQFLMSLFLSSMLQIGYFKKIYVLLCTPDPSRFNREYLYLLIREYLKVPIRPFQGVFILDGL